MKYLPLALFSLLASLPPPYANAADCTLKKMATFDATVERGSILIKAKIDDRDVEVVLDTGAPFNMINNKLVSELKLPTNYGTMAGTDAAGRETHITALAHKVVLGDLVATNVNFLIGGRQSADGNWDVDALFGSNFLEANDLELDLGHGKVNIFESDHCPGQGVYWAREHVSIPIRVQNAGHIYLPAILDGLETVAMLDTGAARSIVDKRTAEGKLNIPAGGGKDQPDGKLVAGSGMTIPYYNHTFGTFDIGGIAFRNTELAVMLNRAHHPKTNDDVSNAHISLNLSNETPVDAPIILGLQHLVKLRMYFSFKENMLYVTPANAQ